MRHNQGVTTTESSAPPASIARLSVVVTWLAVAVGAVLASILPPPGESLEWFPIVLAGGLLLSFCVQLSLDSKHGFVDRLMASVGGSVVMLAIATGVVSLWPAA